MSSARAEETPAEIARKAREMGSLNLLGLEAEVRLTTVASDGKSTEQRVKTNSRRINGKLHSLVRFLFPASVAGVAILGVEAGTGPVELSVYLPKLRRVRKVAAGQRGQPVMGTDVTFSDLAGAGVSPEGAVRLEDAQEQGRPVYVLSGPAGAESPYAKATAWVDKASYVPLRVEYEDREGKVAKRFRALKLQPFLGRTLASEALVETLGQGSRTKVELLEVGESKLGEDGFTERALERG